MYSNNVDQKMTMIDMLGVALNIVKTSISKFWVLFVLMLLFSGSLAFIGSKAENSIADSITAGTGEEYTIPQGLSGDDVNEYIDEEGGEGTGVVGTIDEGPQDTATGSVEPLSFLNILSTKTYAGVDEAAMDDRDTDSGLNVDGMAQDAMMPTTPKSQFLQAIMAKYGPALQEIAPYVQSIGTMGFIGIFIGLFLLVVVLSAIWGAIFYIWPSSVFNNIVAGTPTNPNNIISKLRKFVGLYLLMFIAFGVAFGILGLIMGVAGVQGSVAIILFSILGLVSVWIMLKLAFTFNAVIDDKGIIESIKLSWNLTNNRRWLTLGNFLVIGVVSFVVGFVVGLVGSIHWILAAVLTILTLGWNFVTQAWYVVLYHRYKMTAGETQIAIAPVETQEIVETIETQE